MDLKGIRNRNAIRYNNILCNEKHVKSLLNRTINRLYIHIMDGKSIESFFDEFEIENRLYFILWALYRLCESKELNNVKSRYYFDKKMSHRLQFIELLRNGIEEIREAYKHYDSLCNVPRELYSDTSETFCEFLDIWYNNGSRDGMIKHFVHQTLLEIFYTDAYRGVNRDVSSRITTCLYVYRAFICSSYFKLQGRSELNLIESDITKEFIFERSEEIFLIMDVALL